MKVKIKNSKKAKMTRVVESRRSGFLRKFAHVLARDQKVTLYIAMFCLAVILFLATFVVLPASSISPQTPLQITYTVENPNATNVIEFPYHLAAGSYENFTYNLGSHTSAQLTVYSHPYSLTNHALGAQVESVKLANTGTFSYQNTGPSSVVTMLLTLNSTQQGVKIYLNLSMTSYYPGGQSPYLLIPSVILLLGFAVGLGVHIIYMQKNPEAYWYRIMGAETYSESSSQRKQSMEKVIYKRRNHATLFLFISAVLLLLASGSGILNFLHNVTTLLVINIIGIAFIIISIISATISYLIGDNEG